MPQNQLSLTRSLPGVFVLCGILIGLSLIYIVEPEQVKGNSMYPTLRNNDKIVVLKTKGTIKANDIVVYKTQTGSFIKRVLGLPNETISLGEKTIVIPEKSYFVLGDNKKESIDSRFIGTINEEDIIGKAVFSYWPPKRFGFIN